VRSISIVRRAELFAKIEPDTREDPAPAVEGFQTFSTYCFSCHRIGEVGGQVGPPLVTAGGALTSALPEATVRAYILDAPSANPATKMPSFAQTIDSSAYEKLIAYFEWAGRRAAASDGNE
jgi:mono/diheme cytochrome c family protein